MGTTEIAGITKTTEARRGRPRAGERDQRRDDVLDAALDLLVERGYQRTTMAAVARASGSSKETLYAWFGDKPGLFAAAVRRNARVMNAAVEAALGGDDVVGTLECFATELLSVLTSERALALNRAAISELRSAPELAELLRREGRERTGPIVEAYLDRLARSGTLSIDDPAEAFRLLYGLIMQDAQIQALLGGGGPDRRSRERVARRAVAQFLALAGREEGGAR